MGIQWVWHGARRAGDRVLSVFAVDPSSGRALPYVDGLRAIAVLFIIVLHSWQISGASALNLSLPGLSGAWNVAPLIESFQLGVPLFFVLSGFLLALPFIRAHANGQPAPSLRRYFTLRAARIMPAYYFLLFCLLVLLTPLYVPPALVYSQVGAIAVMAHLFFLQEMIPVASSSFNADPVLWTLTMEVLFYLVLPWVVRYFYGRRWIVSLPLSAVISVGWLFLCWHGLSALVPVIQAQATGTPALAGHLNATQSYLLLERQLPAHAVDFGLGMTVANWYVRGLAEWASRVRAAVCGTAVLGGWALVLWVMAATSDFRSFWAPPPAAAMADWISLVHIGVTYYLRETLASLGFALVLAGVAFGQPWLQAPYSVTPVRVFGMISYSIYLWHYIVISLLARWWPAVHIQRVLTAPAALSRFWLLLLGALVIVVPLAGAIYLLIERPILRLVRRPRAPVHVAPVVAGALPDLEPVVNQRAHR